MGLVIWVSDKWLGAPVPLETWVDNTTAEILGVVLGRHVVEHLRDLGARTREQTYDTRVSADRRYLSRSSPHIVCVSARAACRVPGPLVLCTARSGVLAGSCSCSPIMGKTTVLWWPASGTPPRATMLAHAHGLLGLLPSCACLLLHRLCTCVTGGLR